MVFVVVGSNSWVQVKIYCIIGDVVVYLKGWGMQILVIYFFDKVVDFCEIDYMCLICILMGQEKIGIMQEVLDLVDWDIIILMIGMVQLLNVFVVFVFIFYEVQCQCQNVGMYLCENSMLLEDEQQCLLFEGGYLVLVKVVKCKGLFYFCVNQQGEIDVDVDWWVMMQVVG